MLFLLAVIVIKIITFTVMYGAVLYPVTIYAYMVQRFSQKSLPCYTPIFQFCGLSCLCDTFYTCSKKSAFKPLSSFSSDKGFFRAYKYIRRYFFALQNAFNTV